MIPLLVTIVFHPQSNKARETALYIHSILNDDPAVPGLRIPTRFVPEDGTDLPPSRFSPFDEGEKVFVIVLADKKLKAGYEGTVPEGRMDWGPWVADIYDECQKNINYCCIPFEFVEGIYPLTSRLEGVNFAKAWLAKENKYSEWIGQRVIIELLRFFSNQNPACEDNPKPPLTIFISHAKKDIKQNPAVVENFLAFMKHDFPLDAWFDSGDIPGGSRFAAAIERGVKDSALLCVLTDAYSSREWCRKEVLLAKLYKRPFVVVDALQNNEIRSFPYIGNVPVIRWNEKSGDVDLSINQQAAINLLSKEALRIFYVKEVLNQVKQVDDEILPFAPELMVLIGQKNKVFLYPDPPVGQEELDLINKTEAIAETPLQRFAKNRPLKGKIIALSLSESGNMEKYGLGKVHLDQAEIEISRYLLLSGVTLCYGGHLGDKGYTIPLFELVRNYPVPGIEPVERIINYVGWPLVLTDDRRSDYKDLATFIRLPRPGDLSEKDDPAFISKLTDSKQFFGADSPIRRFAWARGMTEMREEQTKETSARIVLGGKCGPTITATPGGGQVLEWYKARIPGVLEEILISMKQVQPVYLIGGFGGCARMVAEIMMGIDSKEMRWDFQKAAPHTPEMRALYESHGLDWWSYEEMSGFIKEKGINGLNNGLTEQENMELFMTIDYTRIIELILQGLQKVLK
ncbi:MAG: TIR domain-containing protein [Spirochaetales bacterium]|nr:TIR domain-containing protein [Spirochaetales bacterium]